ncbi:hypothetical protein T01_4477 [Trichinella spiralis]|uniref:Uncharacterized protein n=1 Tax=Trichinella spiralis TaxID=6334 RepID=A0A0V1B8V9_TRISP|nr:hypothetical protein T01_4477 [Trichinella spiralis]
MTRGHLRTKLSTYKRLPVIVAALSLAARRDANSLTNITDVMGVGLYYWENWSAVTENQFQGRRHFDVVQFCKF